MKKAELRKLYLQKRKELSFEELHARSLKIKDNFFSNFTLTGAEAVHIFLPIKNNNEINTWIIIQRIWNNHSSVKVIVSRSNFTSGTMENFILHPSTRVVENKWGIPEPEEAVPFPDSQIDIVLMPLLAFDRNGNRVGYGKGFYDRFLINCKSTVLKVGLSLEPPVDLVEDANNEDGPMTHAVTPDFLYAFNKE